MTIDARFGGRPETLHAERSAVSAPELARDRAVGSQADYRRIWHEHHAFVWRCLHRLGVGPATIDDALQEVFLTAFRRLPTFEQRGSLRAWLSGIARRVAFRHRRTEQRADRKRSALAVLPVARTDPEDWLHRRGAEAFLQSFVDGLDRDKREIFVLCELEGLGGREAAAALGVNPNTAYARLRLVRSLFEQACDRARADELAIDMRRLQAAIGPRDRATRRSLGLVLAELGHGASATGAATKLGLLGRLLAVAGQTKAAAAVGAIACATAVIVPSLDRPAADGHAPTAGLAARSEAATATEPRVDSPPAIANVAAPVAVPIAASPEPAPVASTRERRSGARAPADPLERQLNLVEQATAAGDRGAWSDAERIAQRYLAEYPGGELRREAAAVLIEALCQRGDPTARSVAHAQLGASDGEQVYAQRCPSP